jgi:hypothetical protein
MEMQLVNYCPMSKATSYTRVEAHLLKLKNRGIAH